MTGFESYLGIPWRHGADGPDAHDCMSFVKRVQAEQFGIEMDRIAVPDYDDGLGILALINSCGEREQWVPVDAPAHGDVAIVRRPIHIGVWLDIDGGGVLHCLRGAGVIWTPDAAWRVSGFGRRTFLRHRSRM